MSYNTPVLLITFQRLRETQEVFAAIRKARPTRLYIASDGPRASRPGEQEKVEAVRNFLTSSVDWPCNVKTLFRTTNVGCKIGVSSAIDWFFKSEEHGIILEDDCVPHPDFFTFCETMLARHTNDLRVMAINGSSFQNEIQRGDGSYYVSRYMHVWGWATWKRAWAFNDVDIGFWPQWKISQGWSSFFGKDNVQRHYWTRVFDRMYAQKIDTWDHAWVASIWYADGVVVTPQSNMVRNIGFGADATHTIKPDALHEDRPVLALQGMQAPSTMDIVSDADSYVFDTYFGGRNKRWPRRLLFLHKDLKRWIKSHLK
jgi:hypothetical protein